MPAPDASSPSPVDPAPIRVVALSVRDAAGRILTVRKRGTSAFMQPGGKPEPGETPAETGIREIAEELGAEVEDVRPLGEWTAPAANEPGRLIEAVVFTARLVSMAGPQAEIEEVCWYDPARPTLPADRLAPLLRDIVLPALAPLPPVVVVGLGADGHLPPDAAAAVAGAEILIGGRRHLDLVPARDDQERRGWPSPLRPALPGLLAELAERRLVVLASGDPMLSGIGTTLAGLVGSRLRVLPGLSSVALARARMGWSAEETAVVSVVGRDVDLVRRELAPGRRVVVLAASETTPGTLAALLREAGLGASRMSVLGDLGTDAESRIDGTAGDVDAWTPAAALPRLNVVAIEIAVAADVDPGAGALGNRNSWAPGLPDDVYEHDGQLTKRDLRASALARLAPVPGQLLWDVGAGAGSVGIEWMRAHAGCRTIAIEGAAERAERIGANAGRLGVPGLQVVHGRAPAALADLPSPDAVFVGGGATAPGLLELCVERLRPGGRLVVHGVTVETEAALVAAHHSRGGELTRIAVEHAEPLGAFTGFTPARSVTQWAWTKPIPSQEPA